MPIATTIIDASPTHTEATREPSSMILVHHAVTANTTIKTKNHFIIPLPRLLLARGRPSSFPSQIILLPPSFVKTGLSGGLFGLLFGLPFATRDFFAANKTPIGLYTDTLAGSFLSCYLYVTRYYMEIDIPEKFTAIRKGLLEFLVAKIIAARSVYAADILTRLAGTEFATQEGTLYPLLSKMRREGLLDYEWQESENGPPRKYYRLTAKGKEQLRTLETYWQEIITTVKYIQK